MFEVASVATARTQALSRPTLQEAKREESNGEDSGLARAICSRGLTAVWVPDAEHEALPDLVRVREAAAGGGPLQR